LLLPEVRNQGFIGKKAGAAARTFADSNACSNNFRSSGIAI
jgi:hypothetical protein